MKTFTLPLFLIAAVSFYGPTASAAGLPAADSAALPPLPMWGDAAIVDEPQGPYDSIGFTLGHAGRDPAMIRRFHSWLAAQGIEPQSLLSDQDRKPPETTHRILLEPASLPKDALPGWDWKPEGNILVGSAADEGPSVTVPLKVDHAGLYRLWVQYETRSNNTAVTGLKIYRRGEEAKGPLLQDEFYNAAALSNGPAWHDVMVPLAAGDYGIVLSHIIRSWRAPTGVGYWNRRIGSLYLTDEIWADAPADAALAALRATGASNGVQKIISPALDGAARQEWSRWQVRPTDWESTRLNKALFEQSYRFWRSEVDTLATNASSNGFDYRDPHRQIIFDDTWNIVANPNRILRQIQELSSDIRADDKESFYYWIDAGRVTDRTGGKQCDWWPSGPKLTSGTYYNFQGSAVYQEPVEPGHTYQVWVQFRNAGYFEPWQMWAWQQGVESNKVYWKRDQRSYPPDIEPGKSWVRVGAVVVPKDAGTNNVIRWEIKNLPWGGLQGVSYRWIWAFFLTTDPDYTPKGSILPPEPLSQYLSRAEALGCTTPEGYMFQFCAAASLPQTWWPNGKVETAPTNQCVMTPDMVHSTQIGFRSVVNEPVDLNVECGPLDGAAGRFAGKVKWRVVGFVPYGNTRSTWSAWCLLRRPFVTIPPQNVAGIWIETDTAGVPPGDYVSKIRIEARGQLSGQVYPARTATLAVHVSPVRNEPQSPILADGYTMPPEGEAYIDDYQAHRFRIWCGEPISKQEMQQRGMKLQQVRARMSNNDYKPLLQRLKALGLSHDDYFLLVWDEPSGQTEAQLGRFLGAAKAIRAEDPEARLAFNPGEPATLKTFQILDPYCDIWMPYYRHFVYSPAEAAAKTAIITAKPWMEYTTPCYQDKEPQTPGELYQQIRKVPANQGKCIGTWFFALYYPFRDPWDTANEYLRDASVFILPSRHGPVPTVGWELMREAVEHADLAQMVKERAKPDDKAAQGLVASGGVDALINWLEKNPSSH